MGENDGHDWGSGCAAGISSLFSAALRRNGRSRRAGSRLRPDTLRRGDRMRWSDGRRSFFWLEIELLGASNDSELDAAFAALTTGHVGGLLIRADSFLFFRKERLAALAARYAMPAIFGFQHLDLKGLSWRPAIPRHLPRVAANAWQRRTGRTSATRKGSCGQNIERRCRCGWICSVGASLRRANAGVVKANAPVMLPSASKLLQASERGRPTLTHF